MATTSAPKPADPASNNPNMIVVDVGKKQSKKRIRRLRKGEGSLFDKINDTIADMSANGAIKKDAQVVVFVVRRKNKKKILGW